MGVELTSRLPQDANSVERIIGIDESLLRSKTKAQLRLYFVCV